MAFALGSNPVGWVLLGVAVAAGVAAYFMKSKSKMLGEKKSKLYDSIKRNMEDMREEQKHDLTAKFENAHKKITGKVDRYYGIIIDGLEELKNTLSDTLTDQIEFIDDLNRRFGARIINYMTQEQIYSVLNDSQMADLNVWREFRKEIVIARSAFADYAPIYSGAQMTEILQEEVKIAEL